MLGRGLTQLPSLAPHSPWEDIKSAMGPYCKQYKSIVCLFFSLTAKTHLGATQTQILCLLIHTLWVYNGHKATY